MTSSLWLSTVERSNESSRSIANRFELKNLVWKEFRRMMKVESKAAGFPAKEARGRYMSKGFEVSRGYRKSIPSPAQATVRTSRMLRADYADACGHVVGPCAAKLGHNTNDMF